MQRKRGVEQKKRNDDMYTHRGRQRKREANRENEIERERVERRGKEGRRPGSLAKRESRIHDPTAAPLLPTKDLIARTIAMPVPHTQPARNHFISIYLFYYHHLHPSFL